MREPHRVFLNIFISETFTRSYPYKVCISDGPFEWPIHFNRMLRDIKLYKKSRWGCLKINLNCCWHEFKENLSSRFCWVLGFRYRETLRNSKSVKRCNKKSIFIYQKFRLISHIMKIFSYLKLISFRRSPYFFFHFSGTIRCTQ